MKGLGWWLQLEHPACLLKVEMPPPSKAALELEELNHPALYAAIDSMLSIYLASAHPKQTSNQFRILLPGQDVPCAHS